MRLHFGLLKIFWVKAVNTTVYLINCDPSIPLEHRLPEEVWSGKEVSLNHLKVFGCVSYVHIKSNDRSKLDAKAKKCFFISYGDEQFGYLFWDDQNWKIIRSRNVVFHEIALYKDKSGGSTDATDIASKSPKFVSLDILEVTP